MARYAERLLAREFRRKGESITAIAKNLRVSKSSVSYWCTDIFLTEEQKQSLLKSKLSGMTAGRLKGIEINRLRKRNAIEQARAWSKEKLGNLTDRDLLVVGLALYWAEGSKSRNSHFSFVNADQSMILLVTDWLQQIFRIPKSDFILRVAINEMHRPREAKVIGYWSQCLSIPKSQFRKTSFIKTAQQKVYENYDTYFGTLIIRLRKSTLTWYKILECIELLKLSR